MKFNFKNSLMLLFLFLGLVVFYSCEDETPSVAYEYADVDRLSVDLDQMAKLPTFNTKEDELTFVESSHVLLDPTIYNDYLSGKKLESVVLRTSDIDQENLDEFFPGLDPSVHILTATCLKASTGEIDGLILHVSDSEGFLKLFAYERAEDGSFKNIGLQGSFVTMFTLENMVYVARKLFPKRDILTIAGSGMLTFKPRNTFDDVSLLRFITQYNIPVPGYEELVTREYEEGAARTEFDVFLDGPDDSRYCDVKVHFCDNGDASRTVCNGIGGGCVNPGNLIICPYSAASAAFVSNNMVSEQSAFEASLPDQTLYSFEDQLELQPQGQFYVDAYHTASQHFQATLDVPLLYDIAAATIDMSDFVSSMLNSNQNYVLSTNDYNEFVHIAQQSSANSLSLVYKDLVSTLIADAQRFQGQDLDEINSMLESPQLFPEFQ